MVTRLCLLLAFLSNAALAANTLVIHANVITVDKDHPSAQAFAFENGRFTAVGTNEQILTEKAEPYRRLILFSVYGDVLAIFNSDGSECPAAIFRQASCV